MEPDLVQKIVNALTGYMAKISSLNYQPVILCSAQIRSHFKKLIDRFISNISDIKEYFVANQNSDVFHKPGCKWTRVIKEDSIVVFKSVSEAEEKRFKPCRYCKPKPEIKYEYLQYDMRKRRIATC